jgi:hypothetical protein
VGDLKAEREQFAVDPGRAPGRPQTNILAIQDRTIDRAIAIGRCAFRSAPLPRQYRRQPEVPAW